MTIYSKYELLFQISENKNVWNKSTENADTNIVKENVRDSNIIINFFSNTDV